MNKEGKDNSEEIVRLLYGGMNDFFKELSDRRLSAAIFLYLITSIAENITFKQAYERYEFKEDGGVPCEPRCEYKKNAGMPYYTIGYADARYIEYECGYRLVRRAEPVYEIADGMWNDIVSELSKHLIKQLKLY